MSLKGEADSTAPTAKQRQWDFLYARELKAFTRMSLKYVDASGVVVRTVTMKLVATQAPRAANLP